MAFTLPNNLAGMGDTLALCLFQGGKLQVGILLVGRDPRIADVHKPILPLISDTAKPLIGQGRETVSKLLISVTAILAYYGIQGSFTLVIE